MVSSYCNPQRPLAHKRRAHGLAARLQQNRRFLIVCRSAPSLVHTGPVYSLSGVRSSDDGSMHITTGHDTPELRKDLRFPLAAAAAKALCRSGAAFPAGPSFHAGSGGIITSSCISGQIPGGGSTLPTAFNWADVPLSTPGPFESPGARERSTSNFVVHATPQLLELRD